SNDTVRDVSVTGGARNPDADATCTSLPGSTVTSWPATLVQLSVGKSARTMYSIGTYCVVTLDRYGDDTPLYVSVLALPDVLSISTSMRTVPLWPLIWSAV